jgi:hypothetical protein
MSAIVAGLVAIPARDQAQRVEVGRQYQAVCHLNSWSVFSCVVQDTQVINTLRG